jgi:hypothetical protein
MSEPNRLNVSTKKMMYTAYRNSDTSLKSRSTAPCPQMTTIRIPAASASVPATGRQSKSACPIAPDAAPKTARTRIRNAK